MAVVIVDYDAGNLRSVERACHRVGIDDAYISRDPADLLKADRVIFPGVGSADSAVDTLHARGLFEALQQFYASGKPLLGICLGSQIVLGFSEEGDKTCLNLVPGVCQRFNLADRALKIPHIGWKEIEIQRAHPMLKNVNSGDEFYFVHSYYAHPRDNECVIATTTHGVTFCSALAKDNLFATQFHLEKSGKKGLALLGAFKAWEAN